MRLPTFIHRRFILSAICALSACAICLGIRPAAAHAQATCFLQDASALSQKATSVPTVSPSDPNTYITKMKNCLLDSLAQAAAKIILQQMTAQVVNWINSGFKGNAAFPTNPLSMFLDVGDQITGAFLSSIGGSGGLCSPFSIDIRLSLALGQVGRKPQYTCTLDKLIKNLKNGPNISINGQKINGGINGFLGGNFNQGGWPAFLSMTTEPQNNVYGAYLMAQSDLDFQITSKKASINLDLNRGGGFMSFEKCTDIGTVDPEATGATADANAIKMNNPGYTYRSTPDGKITYQSCHTETPGSVIGASLNKQLGSSVDQIVSIHDINSAINQVAAALITQMLKTGLNAISGTASGSNSTQSLINQLSKQENTAELNNSRQQVLENIAPVVSEFNQYSNLRNQAVSVLTNEQSLFYSASACYASQKHQGTQVAAINADLKTNVNPLIAQYQAKSDIASNGLQAFASIEADIENATTIQALTEAQTKFNADLAANSALLASSTEITVAKTDLAAAQAKAAEFHARALSYLNACAGTAAATP